MVEFDDLEIVDIANKLHRLNAEINFGDVCALILQQQERIEELEKQLKESQNKWLIIQNYLLKQEKT